MYSVFSKKALTKLYERQTSFTAYKCKLISVGDVATKEMAGMRLKMRLISLGLK